MSDEATDRRPESLIYSFLKNEAGSTNLNVNGPEIFRHTCNKDAGCRLTRLNMVIVDRYILPRRFGGIYGGLQNGINIYIRGVDGEVTLDFTEGNNIKTNADFSYLAGVDVRVEGSQWSSARLAIRWTLSKAGRELKLNKGESLCLSVNDDLSSLVQFKAMLQGYYV